jgi:uncharacterized small protein (DUF1192 family)
MFDDEPAGRRKAVSHEVGADLSAISVDELRERIRLLQAEIDRLEAEITRKDASRNAAASFFKA